MLEKLSNLGTVLTNTKQKEVKGSFGPTVEGCTYGISLDGTLCICVGWKPKGDGTCYNTNS